MRSSKFNRTDVQMDVSIFLPNETVLKRDFLYTIYFSTTAIQTIYEEDYSEPGFE